MAWVESDSEKKSIEHGRSKLEKRSLSSNPSRRLLGRRSRWSPTNVLMGMRTRSSRRHHRTTSPLSDELGISFSFPHIIALADSFPSANT